MKHATYSASDSSRWIPCEASLVVFPKDGEDNNEAAQEGTNAHTLLETCLKQSKDAAEFVGDELFESFPEWPRLSTKVTEEMAEELQPVLDYISDRYFHVEGETPKLWSEMKVTLADECGGTLDCALYWQKGELLEVIDLKWGKGVMVEASSPQNQIYARALIAGKKLLVRKAILTIAQPRGWHSDGPVRHHEMSGGELNMFGENIIGLIEARKANRVRGKEPEYAPSDEACTWCPGKDDCTARQELAMSHARHANEMKLPGEGFTEEMEFLIQFGDLIINKVNLARARLVDQILRGEKGHGFKCIEGRANRVMDFDTPEDAKGFFQDDLKMRVMDFTEPKMLGIPALEKAVKKHKPKRLKEFLAHVNKPQGSPKLVPEDHKGKSYQKRVEAMFDDESDETSFL